MKEGRSRTDEPGGKVGDLLGAGQSSPGGAGGDSGLHVGGEVGSMEIGSHNHLEAGDNRAGGLPAPLVKGPLKGADPGPGRKISSRSMVGEGGEKDEKDSIGGQARPEMVDESGDSGEEGEDLIVLDLQQERTRLGDWYAAIDKKLAPGGVLVSLGMTPPEGNGARSLLHSSIESFNHKILGNPNFLTTIIPVSQGMLVASRLP